MLTYCWLMIIFVGLKMILLHSFQTSFSLHWNLLLKNFGVDSFVTEWRFLGVKMLEFLRPSLQLQSCLVVESCSKQFYVAKLTNFPWFRIVFLLLFDRKTSALAAELSLCIRRWFVPFIVQGVKIRENDFLVHLRLFSRKYISQFDFWVFLLSLLPNM